MQPRQLRNVLPLVYALVVVIGMLVGAVGAFAIVGALVFAIAWMLLSQKANAEDGFPDRASRRAARTQRRAA